MTTPLPMAHNLTRTVLKALPSGEIAIEEGGDGVYLKFDCDCMDALPYCKARCCSIHGIYLAQEEASSGQFAFSGNPPELKRRADGYCVYNDRQNHHCSVYEDRPGTCRDFHCSRGPFMRGWKLELVRLSGGE